MLFTEIRKEGAMLKIGEFARLSQVSGKTLRHYDLLGLLRPFYIDPESGYRLYEIGQLADMMRILALKDCGFVLDEIADLLLTSDVQATEALLNQHVTAPQQVVVGWAWFLW
jgi:DNA-binding transcriptional MerR regulator